MSEQSRELLKALESTQVVQSVDRSASLRSCLVPLLLFLGILAVYAATAAPATLFGDPSEYQFIPAILGIAHPPGYAFYTLLAWLWQMLVPLGTIAFRTNRLAAAAGAWGVTVVYLITREIAAPADWRVVGSTNRYTSKLVNGTDQSANLPFYRFINIAAPLFGALCLATAPDFWQHAIHSNAHIVSAALVVTHLWLLLRWYRTGRTRWLAVFAITLGWAATHHPITLMGVPAYGLFVLAVHPQILRQWRTLLLLIGCLSLGLLPLLYYPLRSPSVPFGPTDMRTWEGFWGHITARGLRVNLFHFGLPDQLDRLQVFWSLLRLQFPLPVILLVVVGVVWLARPGQKRALLIYAFLAVHLLFTLNTVQDVMAYLLIPFAVLAVAAGIGSAVFIEFLAHLVRSVRANRDWPPSLCHLSFVICHMALFILPLYQAALDLSRGISLRDFTQAEEYVAAVVERFAGRGGGAVLVSDWEHLTPLWVHTYTQGEDLDAKDVELVYVSTASPWVESIWAHIESGPIYLPDYRPAVRDAGFRLVPEESFYRVVAPPVTGANPAHSLDVWADDRVHILGYDLPTDSVRAGESLGLVLYQTAPQPLAGIWMPYAQLGPVEARWTTDSRLLTPQWQAGEVAVERYELPVPFTLPPGEYPLRLGYADLSGGRMELELSTGGTLAELAVVTVLPNSSSPAPGVLARSLANLDNRVALLNARARAGWRAREATWEEPLVVRTGRALHLTLTWHALAPPRESYTVFVHLIDGAGRPVIGHDYTPLGGACPTYLWFPKWLPGQTFTDPYRLVIPDGLPAGDYDLEVGMYGMTSLRRLPVVDLAGSLAGDRVILGTVRVE
jgi:hypothetical protein